MLVWYSYGARTNASRRSWVDSEAFIWINGNLANLVRRFWRNYVTHYEIKIRTNWSYESLDKQAHGLFAPHPNSRSYILTLYLLALTWLNVDRNLEVLPSAHTVNGAKISWKYKKFWSNNFRDLLSLINKNTWL